MVPRHRRFIGEHILLRSFRQKKRLALLAAAPGHASGDLRRSQLPLPPPPEVTFWRRCGGGGGGGGYGGGRVELLQGQAGCGGVMPQKTDIAAKKNNNCAQVA